MQRFTPSVTPRSTARSGSRERVSERQRVPLPPDRASIAGNPQGVTVGRLFLSFISFGRTKEMDPPVGAETHIKINRRAAAQKLRN